MTQNAAPVPSTSVDDIPKLVADLRHVYDQRRTHALEWRLEQLRGIERFLVERESEIHAALRADLGKPLQEAFVAELGFTANEARLMRKKLPSWIKPDKVGTPLPMMPASAHVHHDPLGLVLVIGPWNYPVLLLISPLIGAVAGGNCTILKPSEVAANTSAMIAELLPKYVDPECVKVVQGGVPETTALLEQRFDHILYTGNAAVGRIVMTAAAKHLTPVTLELGGKSP
ncbi:MAG: aldehyde dehydrogenase family protein, partial [Myxococcota bacterium]